MDEKDLKKFEELEKIIVPTLGKSSEEEKQFVLNKILELEKEFPNDGQVLLWKGVFYECIDEPEKAIEVYEQMLTLDPNDNSALEAIEDCKKIINLKKTINRSYNISNQNFQIIKNVPINIIIALKIIILIVCIFLFFPKLIFNISESNILKTPNFENLQKIKVNPLTEYSFLTKQEIYNIRKLHVKKSIFAPENYEPNDYVFGRIVDKKPWWNAKPCSPLNYKGDYHERIIGESKVSAQINNPDALVGISLPYSPWIRNNNREFCYGEYSKFVPKSIYYDKKNNLIIAKYAVSQKFTRYKTSINRTKTHYPLQLSGLNALDFGYKYVYAFDTKNINMFYPENSNINDEIKTFQDFIHLGGSCKYKGGCNNISPMQTDKMFTVSDLPAEINLKLWKKRPINKYMKADIYYKIIFEKL